MVSESDQRRKKAWALVRAQHGVISRAQLLELGFSPRSIEHRVISGRLHPVLRGVYAVGRPDLGQAGRWMAAVVAAGPRAALSHSSAALILGIRRRAPALIEVTVPGPGRARMPGLLVHRRPGLLDDHVINRYGIPVTRPAVTLVDLAARTSRDDLEAAIKEADVLDLIDPPSLREEIREFPRWPGVGILRAVLERHSMVLPDSLLERRFLSIASAAGLPRPLLQQWVNGHRVDFYWPELQLVVETDGLRYHRSPSQQARDARRTRAHVGAGLRPLRFTHGEITYERRRVIHELTLVARDSLGT